MVDPVGNRCFRDPISLSLGCLRLLARHGQGEKVAEMTVYVTATNAVHAKWE